MPSSRSVPRAFPVRSGGPLTSRTSSRSWKARPISPAERRSAPPRRSPRGSPADHAGALEQAGGLQPAAIEVALLADARVEGVAALGQLALGERDRGLAEQGRGAPVPLGGEQREGPREEQVPDRARPLAARSWRRPSGGPGAAGPGRGRRRGPASPCGPARPPWRRGSPPPLPRHRRRAGPAAGAGACRPRRGSRWRRPPASGPCPRLSSRRRRSTSSSRAGSQAPAASITAVTGGGTAAGPLTADTPLWMAMIPPARTV